MTLRMRTHMLALCAALFASTLMAAPAQAEEIAVVNAQEVISKSTAAQAIKKEVEAQQKAFQQTLNAKEKELQKEDQELAKQRSVLSQEAFEQKYRDFRQKAATAQKEVQTKRATLDKAFARALSDIQKNLVAVTSEIAKEKDINMVISSSQVIYANDALDITDEVLSRLNKRLPSLKLQM